MRQTTLQIRVNDLFQFLINKTASLPSLHVLHADLEDIYKRFQEPVRVVVVGRIKSGKSTLINALLGEALLATGIEELTYNVNWLRPDKTSHLIVHYKDKRQAEMHSIEELEALTANREENHEKLGGIEYIDVFFPNPILDEMHLIDTPGLASFYNTDSLNTLRFLGLTKDDVENITAIEMNKADAILALFNKIPGEEDVKLMDALQNTVNEFSTSINTIAVLAKADEFWGLGDHDPLPKSEEIILANRRKYPSLQRAYYYIKPMCGLMALGAQTLTDIDFDDLKILATLELSILKERVQNATGFQTKVYTDLPINSISRKALLRKLGAYGIWLACLYIQEGVNHRIDLSQKLLEASGLSELRNLIHTHFGNRSIMIRVSNGINRILDIYNQITSSTNSEEKEVLEIIQARVEKFMKDEHVFRELKLLNDYYNRLLDLHQDEIEEVMRVTGRDGISCGERLGLGERALISDMLQLAKKRMSYWEHKARDFNLSHETENAAQVLAYSYQRIYNHLEQAEKLLYI